MFLTTHQPPQFASTDPINVGDIWRSARLDGYVKVVDVTEYTVETVCCDIGFYAQEAECEVIYRHDVHRFRADYRYRSAYNR